MPIYQFSCGNTHTEGSPESSCEFEQYLPLTTSETPNCPQCGLSEKVEKVWSITKRDGYSAYPYWTTNINGSPIEVKSARHISQLEKQYNVRLRDDKAYIDEDPMAGAREVNAKKREARREAFIQQWREMRG